MKYCFFEIIKKITMGYDITNGYPKQFPVLSTVNIWAPWRSTHSSWSSLQKKNGSWLWNVKKNNKLFSVQDFWLILCQIRCSKYCPLSSKTLIWDLMAKDTYLRNEECWFAYDIYSKQTLYTVLCIYFMADLKYVCHPNFTCE